MKNQINFKIIFFSSLIFASCTNYLEYKPIESLSGKTFRLLDLNVKNRDTFKTENIDIGEESMLYFSECKPKKNLPCSGKLILNKEIIKFTFGHSYIVKGIGIQGIDFSIKKFPEDLPTLILIGEWTPEKQKNGEYLLTGTLGFKKNYPSILATHEATMKLKIE